MQYDPLWDKKDFLQERASCLNEAESVLVKCFRPIVKTPEDLYYYHLECQKARLRANQTFSQFHWKRLRTHRGR